MTESRLHSQWEQVQTQHLVQPQTATADHVLVASFVLLNLHARHGRQWLSGPRRARSRISPSTDLNQTLSQFGFELTTRQSEKLQGLGSLPELFRHFFMRGLVLDSHEGLVGWMEGRYPLELRLDIPSPAEMLDVQCQGRRYVTLLGEPEQLMQRQGRHRDACDFLLHDFEHAHKFFGDPVLHQGQVRFFRHLRATQRWLESWRQSDAEFAKDLDYLMADMNSHPVHLIKYLKAVVLSAEIRRTGERYPELNSFWQSLFAEWGMDEQTAQAALTLNHPEYESAQAQIQVAEFFLSQAPVHEMASH